MEIAIGNTYEFHSTSIADPELTPFSGQNVVVIRALARGMEYYEEEPDDLYEVMFSDWHTAIVYEGEINGYYLEKESCVEAWKNIPWLDEQMKRYAERWA